MIGNWVALDFEDLPSKSIEPQAAIFAPWFKVVEGFWVTEQYNKCNVLLDIFNSWQKIFYYKNLKKNERKYKT